MVDSKLKSAAPSELETETKWDLSECDHVDSAAWVSIWERLPPSWTTTSSIRSWERIAIGSAY